MATIRQILGKGMMSGSEFREWQKRKMFLDMKKRQVQIIKERYAKGNKQPRLDYLKQVEMKPDFKKELKMMKRILYGK
jgi:hypothetical protein